VSSLPKHGPRITPAADTISPPPRTTPIATQPPPARPDRGRQRHQRSRADLRAAECGRDITVHTVQSARERRRRGGDL